MERATTGDGLAAASGPHLPISTVAGRLGTTAATLRMWQQRYGLGPSHVTTGGHRRYTDADVDRLAAVRRLTARGMATGDAARAVLAAARHGVPIRPGADPVAHRLCAAALDLDGPAVRELLRTHLRRGNLVDTWERVVRPVLGPIGDHWSTLPHGVAVEHLLSHLAGGAFAEVTKPSTAAAPSRGRCVLLASVPDDTHDLPLVALAGVLEARGVTTTLLGAATPADQLIEAVRRVEPAAVVLGCHLPELAEPRLLEAWPPTTVSVAAGPGWDRRDLPSGVALVNDLAAAARVVARSAARP